MKKILIPIGILVMGTVKSQLTPLPSTENYIQTKTYLDYNGTVPSKTLETVQYFDGLGRSKQFVDVKTSPLGKDVVTHIEYDQFGRQVRDYLPIPQSGTQNGAIYTSPLGNASSVYGGEKIYSEKVLENSPLDRIQQQIQVGNDWSAKPVKFEYAAVTVADGVRKFTTLTSWENGATKSVLGENWLYTDNQLYKNTVIDEDGNKTLEFKNGKGQTIMVRKEDGSSTYYVYNEYDQLAFVLPPMASMRGDIVSNTTKHDELCYQYRYDGRGRLVEKKLPGKGWESMVYDKQDRLVATQDAELKAKGQWLYTKYDQYGRVAITGLSTGGERITEQTLADLQGSNNVMRIPTVLFNRQGMDVYYGNPEGSYPKSPTWVTLLSLNYYDSYPDYGFNPAFPANTPEMTVLTATPTSDGRSTKGLPVMSFVKNIEDDNWTRNYTYYDQKGRVIATHSINHLGGYTRTESELNFAGAPKKIVTTHKRKSNESGITVTEHFEYDGQNRLLVHKHQVDDKPEQILAENSYNELSQLKNKKVGNNLQSIDYTYNIRGWMTDINKDQMGLTDLGGKLFSYKIKYNQMSGITNPDSILFPGKDVKPRYNGNIAEVDWRSVESLGANPPLQPKRYGYAYDALNRLTAGYYQNPVNPYTKEHTESLSYDLNGNITNLYRTSGLEGNNTTATVIDELEYTYAKGNQVSNIKDHRNNPSGYEGGGGTIEYDLNGSMWKMPDKNISLIQYNHLNLPNRTEYGTLGFGGLHTVLYGANGIKLQNQISKFECGFASCYSLKDVTDYLDGFQYFRSETINSGGGGGTIEELRMTSERLKYAYEQQAYTIDAERTDPFHATVKTPDLRFFPTAEGFYDYIKDQYIYQYKDHLGNVRISFGRNSTGALEITDANDYYPFGMNHLRTGNSFFGKGVYQNYKYNGKELQEMGMYDYGARMYMPDLGRWGVIDPLAETSRRWSPFAYAFNNPIRFIDPDGRQAEDKIKIFNNGNIERTKDNNPYDTITNEDESKSIQIARTNVTESNPTGDSQIGNINTIPLEVPGMDGELGGTQFTSFQIQNYAVATQVFEFASLNTNVEFRQEQFSFSDGGSTNMITTNGMKNLVLGVGDIFGKDYTFSAGHNIGNSTKIEMSHSHPDANPFWPSGFNNQGKDSNPTFTPGLPWYDRKSATATNNYVFSKYLHNLNGGGYIKYNTQGATYTKTKK
ncbi:DUF6443 domain-containing protein [Chryseobacterium arthrosphaerae]|uniref:DUF6443 domain-containing protein n=1 Tax=Chryseobacterium arthrosphaerae TaxID=651561 RepID=UPI0023E330B3|nr:DUF6443 domain-containing protein [Chryseobacterium arthrosphaerae]WET00024.1 DUF6443 domain-containing protein [Chryseobacterium arthrosphaerae]